MDNAFLTIEHDGKLITSLNCIRLLYESISHFNLLANFNSAHQLDYFMYLLEPKRLNVCFEQTRSFWNIVNNEKRLIHLPLSNAVSSLPFLIFLAIWWSEYECIGVCAKYYQFFFFALIFFTGCEMNILSCLATRM